MTIGRAIWLLCFAVSALPVGGCRTARLVEDTATSFKTLADEAAVLARTSAKTVERVDQTLAGVDKHLVAVAEEMPRIAQNTNAVIERFDESLRRLTEVTEEAISTSTGVMTALTPKLEAILVEATALSAASKEAIETLATRTDATLESGQQVAIRLEEVLVEIKGLTAELGGKLGGTLDTADASMTEATASLARLERSVTQSLAGIDNALDEIGAELRRDDPVFQERMNHLWSQVRRLLDAVVWFLGAGAVIILVTALVFLHHKLTTKRRHRKILRELGLLD